eukprot:800899-Prorocentrum_minimum.AAC.4
MSPWRFRRLSRRDTNVAVAGFLSQAEEVACSWKTTMNDLMESQRANEDLQSQLAAAVRERDQAVATAGAQAASLEDLRSQLAAALRQRDEAVATGGAQAASLAETAEQVGATAVTPLDPPLDPPLSRITRPASDWSVIGTGGPVKVILPTRPASDWSVMGIYPHVLRPIGP